MREHVWQNITNADAPANSQHSSPSAQSHAYSHCLIHLRFGELLTAGANGAHDRCTRWAASWEGRSRAAWGICTRGAGKRCKARSRCGAVRIPDKSSKTDGTGSSRLAGWLAGRPDYLLRLYRSQILQGNMRLKALAEIYTMHSFALL